VQTFVAVLDLGAV